MFILQVAIVAACAQILVAQDIVSTTTGQVRGERKSSVERLQTFYSFRAIPFAEAPVGPLRFEAPRPKARWTGIHEANREPPKCVQNLDPVDGQEDCLYLNVYTPDLSANCRLRPVLFWIHGGGFEGGFATYEEFGPDHLIENDIVVVTIHYRVGIFGFLSSGDAVSPGNNALKDQQLALKWASDNVKSFCGDPSRITIGGQSAGSASVSYHLQNEKSLKLFSQAIMESGTTLNPWAFSRNAAEMTKRVAEKFNIDTSNTRTMIESLKKVNSDDLQNLTKATTNDAYLNHENPKGGFPFGPTKEVNHPDAVITGNSHEILASGKFPNLPILVGFNSLEGYADINNILVRLYFSYYDRNPASLLPVDMNCPASKQAAAADRLKKYYFGFLPLSLSGTNTIRYLSDDLFARGIREYVRLISTKAPTFYYRFSYEGGLFGFDRQMPGVVHSEELGYYWRSSHPPTKSTDLVVRSRMIKLWSNFIIHGNPTPSADPLLQNVIWKPSDAQYSHLDIGENLVLTQYPQKKDMEFWDGLYKDYGVPPYSTY